MPNVASHSWRTRIYGSLNALFMWLVGVWLGLGVARFFPTQAESVETIIVFGVPALGLVLSILWLAGWASGAEPQVQRHVQ